MGVIYSCGTWCSSLVRPLKTKFHHSKKLLRTEQKKTKTLGWFSPKMLQHTSLVPCSILRYLKGNQFVSDGSPSRAFPSLPWAPRSTAAVFLGTPQRAPSTCWVQKGDYAAPFSAGRKLKVFVGNLGKSRGNLGLFGLGCWVKETASWNCGYKNRLRMQTGVQTTSCF